MEELSHTGQQTARTMYNADGWVVHHNTDIWRITGPVDFAAAGMWPTGGAWLCQHLWEHYASQRRQSLSGAIFPVMKGAADFFLSTLITHPGKGWMVVSPSVSPEQGPVTAGTTMDNPAAVRSLPPYGGGGDCWAKPPVIASGCVRWPTGCHHADRQTRTAAGVAGRCG